MLMLMMLSAIAAPGEGNVMGVDDWKQMTILKVAAEPGGATTQHIQVAAGDLDGDGVADEAIVALDCTGGTVSGARYIVSPRDSSSGMASGKRMHKPMTITKEWGAASPQLAKIRPTYNVKTMKGNEKVSMQDMHMTMKGGDAVTISEDGWQPIALQGTDGLCPAAAAAAQKATKTRSNIQNN